MPPKSNPNIAPKRPSQKAAPKRELGASGGVETGGASQLSCVTVGAASSGCPQLEQNLSFGTGAPHSFYNS